MNNNYEVAYKNEWNKLKKMDYNDIAKRLDIKYCNRKDEFTVPYFKVDYILDINSETIYRKTDNKRPSIGDSIIILNYLTYSTDIIIDIGKMVSLKEIPNGGALFYPAFYKSSILELINKFGNNINEFSENATTICGKEIRLGDKGYKFNVLPKINIYIAIWEGDDEISPNATILFEQSIHSLVHIETVIAIGMCVADKVISG